MKTPQEIIDQYPYLGAFLSSAQGNETVISLMEEFAKDIATTLSLRDAEIADLKVKLLANANGWKYAVEQSNSWKEKYERLENEISNVSDFFAKYERRVI